jgi:GGDEF domain-containing protein
MIDPTTERDHLTELSSAVFCYLSLLSSVGDCIGQASPEVGGPYRKRIEQLRTRLFFQATAKTLRSSLKTVQGELNDYAVVAAQHIDQHDLELRRAIVTLEHVLDTRHDFHGVQLREMVDRMQSAGSEQSVALDEMAGELGRCVDRMSKETASMLERVRKEMAAVEEHLRGSKSTDPSTGLLNSREIVRQIEAYRASGVTFTLLRFELHGSITEPVMKQAASRIEKQFRHRDRIARWTETEFLVLFQGPPEVAETRSSQVAKLLAGPYQLSTGARVEIMVDSRLAEQELALAGASDLADLDIARSLVQ